jgi:hypothetical protein
MNNTTIKSRKYLPFLQSSNHRILFLVINIYLIIGAVSLLLSIFYLLGHLNNADGAFKFCIPGFALAISSGVIYFVGYQSMLSKKR